MLPLSGIQHYAYCKRQWGLIHIEKQWVENLKTLEGRILHEKVDLGEKRDTRKNIHTLRSMHIQSKQLGLFGVADVVEFVKVEENEMGIQLEGKAGKWMPRVVEYKRGKPKKGNCDTVQLTAQAICLEEIYGIEIPKGYIFYGEQKRRLEVYFDEKIRKYCFQMAQEMHEDFENAKIHQPVNDWRCKNCSLFEVCMPMESVHEKNVQKYLKRFMG